MSRWSPGPAWLFCPADRPERYSKALERSDVVIVDLEDAVAPADKASARRAIADLSAHGLLDRDRTVIRVNAADSPEHAEDLAVARSCGVSRVMLAKSERPADVAHLDHEVIALVETPRGVQAADALAELDNLIGMMWGADDLIAGLGGTASRKADGTYRDAPRYARQKVLIAAKANGRLALDAVYMDIPDLDGLAAECEDAVATGFDATVAIHPSQVPVIRSAYAPSPDRLDWARRLLAAVPSGGVSTFEGRMVDAPVFKQAARIVQLAGGGDERR